MNAVKIEEAISALAEQPFDANEFPLAFLTTFGNKATTIKRLRNGASNKSDQGGVLQTSNIHLKVCAAQAKSRQPWHSSRPARRPLGPRRSLLSPPMAQTSMPKI